MQKRINSLIVGFIMISIFGTLAAMNLVSASNIPREPFWNPIAVDEASSGPGSTTTTKTTTTDDGNGGALNNISPGFEIIAILLSFITFSAVMWRRRR